MGQELVLMPRDGKRRGGVGDGFVLVFTEPELWVMVRTLRLTPAPASPLREMAEAAATLDATLETGRRLLAGRNLLPEGRVNWPLALAVKALCEPDESYTISERGPLGTIYRYFYGRRGFFVEHAEPPGEVALSFPYTRPMIAAAALRTLGIEAPAAVSARRAP